MPARPHPADREPTNLDLRVFAALQAVFWGVIGSILHRRGLPVEFVAAGCGLAVIVGLVGLVNPRWISSYYRGWMRVVAPVGAAVSWGLLAIVYFGVITPLGLLRRALHGDPLHRERDPQATSYWSRCKSAVRAERYFRQS